MKDAKVKWLEAEIPVKEAHPTVTQQCNHMGTVCFTVSLLHPSQFFFVIALCHLQHACNCILKTRGECIVVNFHVSEAPPLWPGLWKVCINQISTFQLQWEQNRGKNKKHARCSLHLSDIHISHTPSPHHHPSHSMTCPDTLVCTMCPICSLASLHWRPPLVPAG